MGHPTAQTTSCLLPNEADVTPTSNGNADNSEDTNESIAQRQLVSPAINRLKKRERDEEYQNEPTPLVKRLAKTEKQQNEAESSGDEEEKTQSMPNSHSSDEEEKTQSVPNSLSSD